MWSLRRSILMLLLLSVSVLIAQTPQKINYQSVIRNNSNVILSSTTVGVRLSILQGSSTGSSVFTERHITTTNVNGLMSIVIGNGTTISGLLSTINWANGPYFIKTEVDSTGGTNYTITETKEMVSVPYAFYTASGNLGPQGDSGLQGVQGPAGAPGSFFSGTQQNQMVYWDGVASWQFVTPPTAPNMILTYCNNKPVWTTNGYCDILLPTVLTNTMAGISTTYAIASGEVTSDGTSAITARGFCGSQTETNPTFTNVPSNQIVNVTGKTGVFNGGFSPSTTALVYCRAFATNQAGTSYGVVRSFNVADAVLNIPSKPVRSTGYLCPNQIVTFTTNTVGGADAYLWELPTGWSPNTGTVITALPQISVNVGEASYANAAVRVAAVKITGAVNNVGPFSLQSDPDIVGHGTISYTTPGTYTFDVPSCVTKMHVSMNGGNGGLAYSYATISNTVSGSKGALIVGDLFFSSTPGTLIINVAESGKDGNILGTLSTNYGGGGVSGELTGVSSSNYTMGDTSGGPGGGRKELSGSIGLVYGGGGGGASDIRIGTNSLQNRILVAGGGGGQGVNYDFNLDVAFIRSGGNAGSGTLECFPYLFYDGVHLS